MYWWRDIFRIHEYLFYETLEISVFMGLKSKIYIIFPYFVDVNRVAMINYSPTEPITE